MIQICLDKAAEKFIHKRKEAGRQVETGHIYLNLFDKTTNCGRGFFCPSAFAAALFTLSGCISSTAPILTDAKPVLGERGMIHVYTLSQGTARDPGALTFQWSGSRYLVHGKSAGFSDFTAYAYEGRDWILQGTTQRAPQRIEYGLARKLADGVYLLVQLNEEDVDEPTRAKFCTKTQDAACRIATPEQLFVFARAGADKPVEGGALAVVMAGRVSGTPQR
jgi:hypothetical protein